MSRLRSAQFLAAGKEAFGEIVGGRGVAQLLQPGPEGAAATELARESRVSLKARRGGRR